MKLVRGAGLRSTDAGFRGEVRLDGSICFDFVVSLRALFNPRTYTRTKRWSAAQLPKLADDIVTGGKFFFAGSDTALGYGAARVVPRLSDGATPHDLIHAVAELPADELAMYMLDTGETTRQRLALFRRVLDGESGLVSEALDGLPRGWAVRCRQVLEQPEQAQGDLVRILEAYLGEVYAEHVDGITETVAKAVPEAEKVLDVLPAFEAIERLTGGYTLGLDLGLRSVTLAASVFIHPYMSARIDEESSEALIIFGIPTDMFDAYDPVPVRSDLVVALKAMADPNRLAVLRLLADGPLYTTELLRQLKLAQTTVHHHLAQLRAAGLVRQERHRGGMRYSVRDEEVLHILRALEDWIVGSHPDDETPIRKVRP